MAEFHITAVVTFHTEGSLANAALRSVGRAKAYAEQRHLRVEIVAMMDRPDAETACIVENCALADFTYYRVEFGDLGSSRNFGIQNAKGDWVALLDGDDLWCENWLAEAYDAGTCDLRSIVWHPAALIVFGCEPHLFIHVDQEDEDFDMISLSMSNYWASQSFAKRELYLAVPYPGVRLEEQLGYEDWAWNLETVSMGYLHKCVPGTANAYRRRPGSLLEQTTARNAMPKATSLFRKMLLRRGPDTT